MSSPHSIRRLRRPSIGADRPRAVPAASSTGAKRGRHISTSIDEFIDHFNASLTTYCDLFASTGPCDPGNPSAAGAHRRHGLPGSHAPSKPGSLGAHG
jgi:hypothetical protein